MARRQGGQDRQSADESVYQSRRGRERRFIRFKTVRKNQAIAAYLIEYWLLAIVIPEEKAFLSGIQCSISNIRYPMASPLHSIFKRNPETTEELNAVFACAGRLSC